MMRMKLLTTDDGSGRSDCSPQKAREAREVVVGHLYSQRWSGMLTLDIER